MQLKRNSEILKEAGVLMIIIIDLIPILGK